MAAVTGGFAEGYEQSPGYPLGPHCGGDDLKAGVEGFVDGRAQ